MSILPLPVVLQRRLQPLISRFLDGLAALRNGKRLWRFGLLTALIWALIHVQYSAYEIAIIFIMGIMLGIVRLRTGSLWSAILMHAFMNFVATLQLALNMDDLLSQVESLLTLI